PSPSHLSSTAFRNHREPGITRAARVTSAGATRSRHPRSVPPTCLEGGFRVKVGQLLSFSVIYLWVLAARGEPESGPADGPSTFTLAAQAKVQEELNWSDRRDFALADRGFLGTRADPLIRNAAGQPVWDLSAFDFLKADAPPTVNPSLLRHSQLLSRPGLFQVGPPLCLGPRFRLAIR